MLRSLAQRDVRVVTLSRVPRSLEDVYLRAVRGIGEERMRVVDGRVVTES